MSASLKDRCGSGLQMRLRDNLTGYLTAFPIILVAGEAVYASICTQIPNCCMSSK